MLQDFLALIYPRTCVACGNSLLKHEEELCNYCYIHLPKSNFHKHEKNPVATLFYGRTPLVLASSFYLFQKNQRRGNKTQKTRNHFTSFRIQTN